MRTSLGHWLVTAYYRATTYCMWLVASQDLGPATPRATPAFFLNSSLLPRDSLAHPSAY